MKNFRFFVLIISLIFLILIFVQSNFRIKANFVNSNHQIYNTQNPPKISEKANIEIVDWSNRLSSPPFYYYVEGILKNIGNKTADFVKVKVTAYDIDNKLISINDSYADPSTISSGQESTFQILVEKDSRIKTFKVSVTW